MLTLFWFALVLGGGLAVFSLLGDFFEAAGADDLHIEHDTGDAAWQLLSLRTATYFLFAFGASGVLIHLTSDSALAALAGALFTGVAAALLSSTLFRYMRRTSSGALAGDAAYEGLQGRVVLPLKGGHGKIVVRRGGRDIELLAQCYDSDAVNPETWTDVVVIEIRHETALVSPLHEFAGADALLPPATEQ
jgi:membrane protein implicated in regulation of membrane protease activity